MKMNINLPSGALLIIERLSERGFRGDIVGGCVRDHLLLKEPHDYDITTSATPEEMKEIFSDMRTIETGIRHGTLTVMHEGEPYEVTTYRLDGEYSDNRHPDSVSFTRELRLDLSRRDFTVNAMCYSPEYGVTDYFGGMDDLKSRLIRAVGVAEQRFTEDALRILRALRFAATLDFEIEEETAAAIFSCAHLMKNVSRERIMVEYTKLIAGVGAYGILTRFFDVIASVVPGITLDNIKSEAEFLKSSPTVRELALFNSATDYEAAMRELKSDNLRRNYGIRTLSLKDHKTDTPDDLRLLLIEGGPLIARDVCALKRLRGESDPTELFDEVLDGNPCYKLSDLSIKGDDLSAIGFRGKEIGETLSKLLVAVALAKVENDTSALKKYALDNK